MGFCREGSRFLLYLAHTGVNFSSSATIGRQCLVLSRAELRANFLAFGKTSAAQRVDDLFRANQGYGEEFLRALGAASIDSFDASAYEGCTQIHDLNVPIPSVLHAKWSAVIDGGSLEHVFNYPVALASTMKMVRPGGHLILMTPTHRASGHGFYQLSPELLFRALTPENGFEIKEVLVCRDWKGKWYRVSDPRAVGKRIFIEPPLRPLLFVAAKRLQETPIFEHWPQQSDYETAWSHQPQTSQGSLSLSLIERLARPFRQYRDRLPLWMLEAYERMRSPSGLRDRATFKEIRLRG